VDLPRLYLAVSDAIILTPRAISGVNRPKSVLLAETHIVGPLTHHGQSNFRRANVGIMQPFSIHNCRSHDNHGDPIRFPDSSRRLFHRVVAAFQCHAMASNEDGSEPESKDDVGSSGITPSTSGKRREKSSALVDSPVKIAARRVKALNVRIRARTDLLKLANSTSSPHPGSHCIN
jgi:hypothetical protein